METSDIESEDERRSKKRIKKKKGKRSEKGSKKNFRMNPFSSSTDTPASPILAQPQDRFASGSDECRVVRSDHAPRLPERRDRGLGLPPSRPSAGDNSDVEDGMGLSPTPTKQTIELSRDITSCESPQCSHNRNANSLFPTLMSPDDIFHVNLNDVGTPLNSPPASRRNGRRSSLDHVTNAIGVLAKQPGRLAKQPVRFAKYTTKKVRKGVGRVRRSGRESSEDEMDFGWALENTPSPKLSGGAGNISSDDDEFFPGFTGNSIAENSFSAFQQGPKLPSRAISDSEEEYSHRFNPRYTGRVVSSTSQKGHLSPQRDTSRSHRSSLSHVTNAIGVLAKQPVKLAKQPVRLAKYTSKKVRKRVVRRRKRKPSGDDDDDEEDSLEGDHQPDISRLPPVLPPCPPVYFSNRSVSNHSVGMHDSSDDDHVIVADNQIALTTPFDNIDVCNESGDDDIDESDRDDFAASDDPAPKSGRQQRRSSLQHVTSAIGTVAKQPYKFAKYTAKQPYKLAKYTAKQPIKFAKYTGKSIRKRMKKKYEESDIVSDPEDVGMSEDDNGLDLEQGSVPSSPVPPFRVIPQRLLSPIMDGSEYNSSEELSTRLDDVVKSNIGDNSLDLSDVMIDDLEEASEDEDIIEAEPGELSDMPIIEHSSGVPLALDRVIPRRVSMTGEVHPSDEFSPSDVLEDLIADVDQEDMKFLEAATNLVSRRFDQCERPQDNASTVSSVRIEKNVIVHAPASANPQDMEESESAMEKEQFAMSRELLAQQGAALYGGSMQCFEEQVCCE